MITEADFQILTELYFYICKKYNDSLQYICKRFSNNSLPVFTDEEILTIYLFVQSQEQRFTIKGIHEHAKKYLIKYFPKLVSYQAFNNRINRLSEVLKQLTQEFLEDYVPSDCSKNFSLIDSMPIITCSGKRQAKVATKLTDKTYCSTKNLWYFGVKMHVIGFFRPQKMPHPEQIILTKASENDLNVFKETCSNIKDRTFFGDKIYHNISYFNNLYLSNNTIMFTPVKAVKGEPESIRQFDRALNDLFSTSVSRIRQPIESLFNWLIQKTDIQRASKVRSVNGLLVHIYGKLATSYLSIIFNT